MMSISLECTPLNIFEKSHISPLGDTFQNTGHHVKITDRKSLHGDFSTLQMNPRFWPQVIQQMTRNVTPSFYILYARSVEVSKNEY